jgi:hypothetical protein
MALAKVSPIGPLLLWGIAIIEWRFLVLVDQRFVTGLS